MFCCILMVSLGGMLNVKKDDIDKSISDVTKEVEVAEVTQEDQ